MRAQDRLIVALDFPTSAEAMALVDRLGDRASWFKVGMGLFTAEGPEIVKALRERDRKIFVDLKFHDIPTQVGLAARSVVRIGANLMNVHASAGFEVMCEARNAVGEAAEAAGVERPVVVAVTLLTSLDHRDESWGRIPGADDEVAEMVVAMARVAQDAGLDGVVCSGREVARVKETLGSSFVTVVPGIRPAGSSADDQKRVLTPAGAIAEGADYLVIGRPITQAPDPVAAMEAILHEMEESHAA